MSLKGYAYESVERFALTMTQQTEEEHSRRFEIENNSNFLLLILRI